MRILIIGGTGHIGSYLTPRMVLAGHDVTVVARNPQPQYTDPRLAWPEVSWVVADRAVEEQDDTWAQRMRGIETDVVIDLICYTPEQNRVMMDAFDGRVRHFLHCGTIWAYGPSARTPYRECYARKPITDYGLEKARIEAELLERFRQSRFPATICHPGHISGRRWLPIDPQGTRNGVDVYLRLAQGKTVHLPEFGRETIHHVHGDDVAQMFQRAIENREAALGESFSTVAPYAMSLVGCCEFVASLFGREPCIEFVPMSNLASILGKAAAAATETHVEHSPCSSIEKAQRLLGYAPRYTTEQIYTECIEYLLESGQLVLD